MKFRLNLPKSFGIELGALLFILALAGFLRFHQLADYPGWYSDEGNFINFTQNLMEGRWQIFSLQTSPLIIGRPPLFFYCLAVIFKLWGANIYTLRLLTASFGVLSVAGLYGMARSMSSSGKALASAFILAVMPWSVFFARIGFTYNLLALWTILTVWSSWVFLQNRRMIWLWVAGLTAGLGLATDYLGMALIFLVIGIALFCRPRASIPLLGWVFLPTLVLLLPSMIGQQAQLGVDSSFTFGNLTRVSWGAQVINLFFYYGELMRRETWVLLALAGYFWLEDSKARTILLFVVILTLLVVARTMAPVGRNFHYFIQLLPLLCFGLAVFWVNGMRIILTRLRKDISEALTGWKIKPDTYVTQLASRLIASATATLILFIPLCWMLFVSLGESFTGGSLAYFMGDDLNLTPTRDANIVLDFVNEQMDADDLLLASPQLAWASAGHMVDFYTILAVEGKGQPAVIQVHPDQFVYDSRLNAVDFAILDPLATVWAASWTPDLPELIEQIRSWKLVKQQGDLYVYCNPERCP